MDTCICKAKSLHCSPETIALLIGYIPTQNKVCFLKKKKKKRFASNCMTNLIQSPSPHLLAQTLPYCVPLLPLLLPQIHSPHNSWGNLTKCKYTSPVLTPSKGFHLHLE